MTTVGKIMVIFVLLFSLAQGALAIMLYAGQTRWAQAYKAKDAEAKVAQASADTYQADAKKAQTDADARIAQRNDQLKKLQNDAQALQTEIQNLQAKAQEFNKQQLQNNAVITASQFEVQRRQADVDELKKTLSDQLAENKKLLDLNNTLTTEKVTAEIQARTLQDRNTQLAAKLEDLARERAREKATVAGGAAGKAGLGKNPPVENIEGLVRQVQGNFVKITIGSDANLAKGNTLEVFRLSSIPDQSKYLGTIKIIDVSATEAVGEPMGRMAAPLQVGDHVASRILGG
jgi:hypothetical protein